MSTISGTTNSPMDLDSLLQMAGMDQDDLKSIQNGSIDSEMAVFLKAITGEDNNIALSNVLHLMQSALTAADHPELEKPGSFNPADALKDAKELINKLKSPLAGMDIEAIAELLQEKTKNKTIQSSLAQLDVNAKTREAKNNEQISKLNDQIEECKKKENMSGWQKFLAHLKTALSVLSAVLSIVTAIACPNPLTILSAICAVVMAVDAVLEDASGGKYSIAAGCAELAKAIDKDNKFLGPALSIAINLMLAIGACAGGFSGATSMVSSAVKIVQLSSAIISTLTSMAQSGMGIANAVIDKKISDIQSDMAIIKSILAQLAAVDDSDLEKIKEELSAINFNQEIVESILDNQATALKASASQGAISA